MKPPNKKQYVEAVIGFLFLLILARRGEIMIPFGIIVTGVFTLCFTLLIRSIWSRWDRRHECLLQVIGLIVLAFATVALDVIALELLFIHTEHT